MPTITVGLPFHNAQDTLADAVRSVFAQTFADWELILVDDGSTDDSLTIARSIQDPRVHVVSDGVRRRLPGRLNEIADRARADLIARLDADDMAHPNRLARQLQLLAEHPTADVISTSVFSLDANDSVMTIAAEGTRSTLPLGVLRHGLLAHATIIARRAWVVANRYDERYPRAEDRELFARTCTTLRFVQLDEPLYLQRHRKDMRHTLRDYVATTRDNRRIFREHGPRLVGAMATAPLLVESLAKETVFRAMTWLGAQELLVRRRGRAPTAKERADAASALRQIRETAVPGLTASP